MMHAVTLCLATLLTAQLNDLGLAEDFTLQDPRGKKVVLSECTDRGLVVLVFLGTDCPISRRYAPVLKELHDSYLSDGVEFVGISSNPQDSDAEVVRFAVDYAIPFPIVKDSGAVLANALKVDRTPTAVLVDKQRKIRYRGRIDDQYELDFDRPNPTRLDLVVAIAQLRSGEPISLPVTGVAGCRIGKQTEQSSEASVTWHNQVAKIFRKHCHHCHRTGRSAPFPLVRYSDIEGWGPMIEEVILAKRMPPWRTDPHYGAFADARPMTTDEVEAVLEWVNDGCPEGQPTDDSVTPTYGNTWQLSENLDKVIPMNEAGYTVPARGPIEYRYYVVDPGFTEGAKVAGAEILPSSPSVVCQAAVFCLLPGLPEFPEDFTSRWDLHANLLCWYAPGAKPIKYPPDAAKSIPPGAKLVFQIAYRPCGRPVHDRTSIGLILAEPSRVRRTVKTIPILGTDFTIPPEDRAFQLSNRQTMPDNYDLISLIPRMNLRGKSVRFVAKPDSGYTETLMSIPDYSPYWQFEYRLEDPSPIDQGTVVECAAVYDNSRENPINPDPSARVRPGTRFSDELMVGYLEVIPRLKTNPAGSADTQKLRDSSRDISMALGGLAATTMICLSILWLKPVRARPVPAPPTH